MARLTNDEMKEVLHSWNVMAGRLNEFTADELTQLLKYEMRTQRRYFMAERILIRKRRIETESLKDDLKDKLNIEG